VDLQTDIDGIQADLAQVNDDIARATSKHRQGLAARLTDLKSELDSGLAEKQAALKALQDSGACGFNLDGSAGYDHTFDPDNAGFSSVCAEATTSPPVDGAAWEATFSDDSHHDADVTKTGTTGADGIVKTVYRITSGSKKVHIVVKVTKASQTASKTFDIQVPAPDSTKSKDCKAVNGG
jgi:hypothetical protein